MSKDNRDPASERIRRQRYIDQQRSEIKAQNKSIAVRNLERERRRQQRKANLQEMREQLLRDIAEVKWRAL